MVSTATSGIGLRALTNDAAIAEHSDGLEGLNQADLRVWGDRLLDFEEVFPILDSS
jgi:hypothetical protein